MVLKIVALKVIHTLLYQAMSGSHGLLLIKDDEIRIINEHEKIQRMFFCPGVDPIWLFSPKTFLIRKNYNWTSGQV